MTNETKLLPCPCCGGEAKEMYTYLAGVEWVACLQCGLKTKGFGSASAAAKAWNTRPDPAEDVRAAVDEQHLFESVFPMPAHTTRFKGGYAATEFNAWTAHEFVNKWDGWKARTKFNS